MTKQNRSRQSWWPLYTLALMMVGLLFLAHYVAPSPGWRTFLEIGIVIVGYGLMVLWLNTHPAVLLDEPSAEAYSPTVKSSQLQDPAPMSSQARRQVYADSDPAIINGGPEHPTGHPDSNGHHPAKTRLYLPEEVAKQFTNN
jgi:hypothetical protein